MLKFFALPLCVCTCKPNCLLGFWRRCCKVLKLILYVLWAWLTNLDRHFTCCCSKNSSLADCQLIRTYALCSILETQFLNILWPQTTFHTTMIWIFLKFNIIPIAYFTVWEGILCRKELLSATWVPRWWCGLNNSVQTGRMLWKNHIGKLVNSEDFFKPLWFLILGDDFVNENGFACLVGLYWFSMSIFLWSMPTF